MKCDEERKKHKEREKERDGVQKDAFNCLNSNESRMCVSFAKISIFSIAFCINHKQLL